MFIILFVSNIGWLVSTVVKFCQVKNSIGFYFDTNRSNCSLLANNKRAYFSQFHGNKT